MTEQATIQPAGEPLRFLKTVGELRLAAIRIAGDTALGKERVVSVRGLRSAWQISQEPGQRSAGRAAYSSEELQRLGWQCLKSALEAGGATELQDLQALRGIGADGIDGLKRYFELKTSGRGLPSQVSLTPNEVERAQREGDKFFLAVVSGLEKGSTTTIRIFANPLQTLDWRVPNGLTLVGLHEKRGLTIQLGGADSPESAVPADTPDSLLPQ